MNPLLLAILAPLTTSLTLHPLNTTIPDSTVHISPTDSIVQIPPTDSIVHIPPTPSLVRIAAADFPRNVARGRKLLSAMRATDAQAASIWNLGATAQSAYDGDLRKEMRQWGWNDDPVKQKAALDVQCDFHVYHKITRAFTDLGMQTTSKANGGPNECFTAEHWDGPLVKHNFFDRLPKPKDQRYMACGKTELSVTEGYYRIAINAPSGAILALDRKSPAHAAQQLWRRAPKNYELPALRAASDITWAFWHRATGSDVDKLQNVRFFFNCLVVNEETLDLIRMAHERMTPPRSAPGTWPGTEFSMDSEAGLALLGSPLGRSHGFFLIQHKRQLGGDKYISKVRVFKNDALTMPYMVFYVADAEESEVLDALRGFDKGVRAKL